MYSSKTFNTKETATSEDEARTWPPKVTYRNAKTGLVERQDPYIMRTVGSSDPKNRDRANYMEYPAGSGNLYDRNWEPCGRWDANKPEGQRYLKDATHIAWNPPETQDHKLAKEVAQKDVRIAELEKELASIQAEKEVKSAPKNKSGA